MEAVSVTIKLRMLINDLVNGHIIPNPEWQRGEVWTNTMSVDLIETINDKMPIPQITLWKQAAGKAIVVDGRQRLTAIHKYMKDELKINKISVKKYADLDDDEKGCFGDTDIYVLYLSENTHPEVIVDYFQRINARGKTLTSGELIHSHKPFSSLVKEVHYQFFESDFHKKWIELFKNNPLLECSRKTEYENTVGYLASSLKGVEKLTKSYPILADTLKSVTQIEIYEHRETFLAQLELFLEILHAINEKVPGWADGCKTGLPLLRQMSPIWYTIIDPSLLDEEDPVEFWSSFYETMYDDDTVMKRWSDEMRRNGKPAQLKLEVQYAKSLN